MMTTQLTRTYWIDTFAGWIEARDMLGPQNDEALQVIAELKAAEARADGLQAEVESHRAQQAQIRLLVNAYPEHDTVEAVRRFAGRLHDAEAERDMLTRRVESLQATLTTVNNDADEARAERNTAWAELRVIRQTIGADENEATSDEVARIVANLNAALDKGQINCDAAYNDLRAERDDLRRQMEREQEIIRGLSARLSEAVA
jgi:prefoldin subunit 5